MVEETGTDHRPQSLAKDVSVPAIY